MRVRVLSVAVGVVLLALLAAAPARAVALTCELAFAAVTLGEALEENVGGGCPSANAHLVSSGAPADVSGSAAVSANTITLSHDRNQPTATQTDFIYWSTVGRASFLAPAEEVTLAVALSFYDDASLGASGFANVRLTRGAAVLLDSVYPFSTGSPWPLHEFVLVSGLTTGEELVLYVELATGMHTVAAPAGNSAKLSVSLVPEPGTALLLAGGLGALAARRTKLSAPRPESRPDR